MIPWVRIGANMSRQDHDLPGALDRVMAGVDHLPTRETSAIYSEKVVDRVFQISSSSFLAGELLVEGGAGGQPISKARIIRQTWRSLWRKRIMEHTGSSSLKMKNFG